MALDLFRELPTALSALQRRVLIVTIFLVALTRLPAISATLCEWDESLFVDAVREYDVTVHHPHPPGFPVYLAAAKLVALLPVPEFRALQTVVVLAAMALFPLMFFLARELRLDFRTSYLGALLYVFLPNVWYLGGTAYSDIPSIALVLCACALLLRGCRDVRAYFAGAVLLGLAAGIRPQSLLFALAPALLASWCQWTQSWRRFAGAVLLGAAVLAASYGGAMLASQSVEGYLNTLRALNAYLHDVDSFFNPQRIPLPQVAESVFLRAISGGRLPLVVSGFALIGVLASIVRRKAGVWLLIAMFLPFAIFAWLMLDPFSVSRYSVAWLPLYAFLAAYGISSLFAYAPRMAPIVEIVLIGAITARFAWWTWPALQIARTTKSPVVAAIEWAASRHGTIYYETGVRTFVSALRPASRSVRLDNAGALPVAVSPNDVWVAEGPATDSLERKCFHRDDTRFAQIVRQRYLTVCVAPAYVPVMGSGWWPAESDAELRWRWMSGRSQTWLAALGPKARLAVRAGCATDSQTVDVALNGSRIAAFPCSRELETHEWTVAARAGSRNELVLTTNRVINPARDLGGNDTRDLGMRIEGISWKPAQ